MGLYRSGGGKMTETTLWTNSSPTSTMADTTATLSDNLSNYDYLKVTYRISTSNATTNEVIVPVSDFKAMKYGNTYNFMGVSAYVSSLAYCRPIEYTSETTIKIYQARKLYNSGYGNTIAIPTKISGLKL